MWMAASILSPIAWADDVTPTDTPAEITTPAPDPTNTPDPTPTETTSPSPTPVPVTVTNTGDASSAADTQTTVNTNTDIQPGSVNPNGCGVTGQTPCTGDVNASNDNSATTSADLSSGANTGENDSNSTPSGGTEINTGDATADGQMGTEANTNAVILSTPAPTETPTPTPGESLVSDEISTPAADPASDTQNLTVNNSNIADVANNADVTSLTGNNTGVASSGTVAVNTGNATSLVNVLNIINTNIVGSDVHVLTLDLTCTENTDVDLNAIWKELLTVDANGNVVLNTDLPQTPNLKITITNENQASVTNDVNVSADSGNNTASGGAGTDISTGNAAAGANVTNIVNTNILGSKFLLGNINIYGAQNMNIILPRPDYFDPESSALIFRIPMSVNNQNSAVINNDVNATANTGDNSASGSGNSNISTGNAVAVVNSTTLANLNVTGDTWFFLILNNTGGWTGNILNWSSAGSIQKAGTGVTVLQAGLNPSQETTNNAADATTAPPVLVNNTNLAEVTNNINVAANTGDNTANAANGNSNITTGNAQALANLTNLVNMNILGSRWFLNNINILGSWSGNAIFAYPDVGVALTEDRDNVQPGDIIHLDLKYGNTGYDTARGVKVNLDLPVGMSYVADTGKLTGGCQQTFCSWEVGTLEPRQAGDFEISVRINDNFNFDQKQAFWENFIPSVKADSETVSREVPIKAEIQMAESDPNTADNSFALDTVVYEKTNIDSASTDPRQPDISVSARNNVNNFVYPGDTVTFEIKVNNNADVPLSNAQLIQKLYNQSGAYLGSMLFELGQINAYKSGRVTFGLTVPPAAGAGIYHTEAYVTGTAPNGNQVTSGSSTTQFTVKLKPSAIAIPASTVPTAGGEVLGASTTYRGPWCTDRNQDIWIFVMLLLTSSVLFANRIEDKLDRNYVKKTG
jgi:hypothetical protein